jgi:hypothetical protein
MTGRSPRKIRVYLSDEFLSPLSSRKDFDDAAIDFKKSVSLSINSSRLNADIAVKALPSASQNADGKKRTNTGEIPGVVDIGGVRFKPNEKGGPGKEFRWLPSLESKLDPTRKTPNFGWVDKPETKEKRKSKPEIVVSKYKISPKTGQPIEGSEFRVNPYRLWAGEPEEKGIEFKKLPGRSIGQSIPGGNLAARAAARFGIWVDEFNKFRCPPGTPAANQFTDSTGSNCFGLQPGKIVELAKRVANTADEMTRLEMAERNAATSGRRGSGLSSGRVVNNMWWKNHWGVKKVGQGRRSASVAEELQRWGYDIISPDLDLKNVSVEETPSQFRWFISGAKRATTGLEASKRRVKKLQDSLGISVTPGEEAVNADLVSVIDELKNRGLLDTEIMNRKSYEEVVRFTVDKLRQMNPQAWALMSDEQKQKLINADVDRWYATERSMLSAFIDSYIQMPEHMKNIKMLNFEDKLNENAGYLDEASANAFDGGFENSVINIDLPQILRNQEAMLPSLEQYSRMRIDAIGGSDGENAQELSDFLVSSQLEARRTAALALGHEGFARHIMYHEIGHTVQIAAVGRKIKEAIERDGKYDWVWVNEETGEISRGTITSVDEITAGAVISALKFDPELLESINNAISRSDAVGFLAGSYPQTESNPSVKALEIGAELFALRMSGLIWGDDVDAALEYMDDVVDSRFYQDRLDYDLMEQATIDSAAIMPTVKPQGKIIQRIDAEKFVADRREEFINIEKREIPNLSDDELVSKILNLTAELDDIKQRQALGNYEISGHGAMNAERDRRRREEIEPLLREHNRIARDRFGSDLENRKKEYRERNGLLSDQELLDRAKRQRTLDIANNAKNDDEDTLVDRLADIEAKLMLGNLSDEEKANLEDERRKYRKAIRDKRSTSGKTSQSETARLNKFIDKKVQDRLVSTGRTKKEKEKAKTFNNGKSAEEHALSERDALLSKATLQERKAILELSDPDQVDIGNMLDPTSQVGAAKAINKRNRRAMKMWSEADGAEVDESSKDSGSLVGQVENILIPSLDLVEKSELSETIEVETTLDLDEKQLAALKDADDIVVDGLLVGRVFDKRKPFTPSTDQQSPEQGGKKPTKVVVRAEKGQRGYFPHWSDTSSEKPEDYDQKMVMPPGRLRIVEKRIDKDGNEVLIAEIVKQDNPIESLDSMVKNIGEEGPNPDQHARGTRRKLETAVNRYSARRVREGKEPRFVTTQKQKEKIDARNSEIVDELESLIPPTKPELDQRRYGSTGEIRRSREDDRLTRQIRDTVDKLLGPEESREDRATRLNNEQIDIVQRLMDIVQFGNADDDIEISPEDITPEVERLLKTKSPQELIEIARKESKKIRDGLDKRPRVRLRNEELDDVVKGKSRIGSPEDVEAAKQDKTIGQRLREAIDALDTPETRQLLGTVSKTAARKFAEDELQYMVDDGIIDEKTKIELIKILDVAIPEDESQFDPVELVSAIRSVIEKRKAKVSAEKQRGLSSGTVGMLVNAWNEWNQADPDNLQLTQDLIALALTMRGSEYSTAQEYVMSKYNEARSTFRRARERRRGLSSGSITKSSRGEDIYRTESIDEALSLMSEGKLVELDSVERVATLIDKLNEMVQDAKKKGEKAPNYDLCKVSVPGTNLFCSESKGIARINMPQFSGKPIPGSKADSFPKSDDGNVDGTKEFEKHLAKLGINVKRKKVLAAELKATQNELVGSKVVGMIGNEKFDPAGEPIFVSRDGYVIDGHHRWAAQVGRDLSDGTLGDLELNVIEVDAPISEILREANKWAEDFGIAAKSGKGEGASIIRGSQKREAVSGATPEPRSPGLKANRDRSVREYGMNWKPEYTDNKEVEAAKQWSGWDDVDVSTISLDEDILPTESHLKGSSIDKVVSGEEPFREGYDPHLLIDEDGKIYVIDGHNRVAMHRALGNKNMRAKIIDLRKTSAPWPNEGSSDKRGLSSGRKYGGYDLPDPDNPEPNPGQYSDDVIGAAKEQRDKIAAAEKQITETMIDLANKHGGKMEGLAFRLKAIKSLARKIASEKDSEHDGDARKAAESMSDVVRYTSTFEPENYVEGVKGMVKELEEQGYKLRIKNYWVGDDPYQGINIAATAPDGTKFELQFHTPQSVKDKEDIHVKYEEYREASDTRRRYELYNSMVRMAKRIEVPYPPDALLEIGQQKFQDFQDASGKTIDLKSLEPSIMYQLEAIGIK